MIDPPGAAVIMIRPVDPDEADRIRADTVSFLLHRIITDLKVVLSPADWQNWGIAELEAFTVALHTNGKHPLLNKCGGGHCTGWTSGAAVARIKCSARCNAHVRGAATSRTYEAQCAPLCGWAAGACRGQYLAQDDRALG
jgi:hypothetical protein